jgi:hypothetical protein
MTTYSVSLSNTVFIMYSPVPCYCLLSDSLSGYIYYCYLYLLSSVEVTNGRAIRPLSQGQLYIYLSG